MNALTALNEKAIWGIPGMRSQDYRMIFWMIDAGAAHRVLGSGWMSQCSRDLGIHRITVNRIIKKLDELGIVNQLTKKGEYTLCRGAFDCYVDINWFHTREKDAAAKSSLK